MLKRPVENKFTRSENVTVEIQAKVHFDQPNLKQIQRKLQNVMPLRIKQKQLGHSDSKPKTTCMYLKHDCITLPKNHILLATMWLMFPVFDLTHGKYWIFNHVQVMGFQILQDYVIDVSCFQICSIQSLKNVILCWEAHFLGRFPDFYIALKAFNVFYIFLPCLIFWKCCFSLCWKQ